MAEKEQQTLQRNRVDASGYDTFSTGINSIGRVHFEQFSFVST